MVLESQSYVSRLAVSHTVLSSDSQIANGRIPAIVDKTSGKPKRVFEGASIQLYLCAKYDKDYKISFPYDSDEYWVGFRSPVMITM